MSKKRIAKAQALRLRELGQTIANSNLGTGYIAQRFIENSVTQILNKSRKTKKKKKRVRAKKLPVLPETNKPFEPKIVRRTPNETPKP